jgi:hypothetical protein
MRKDPYPPRSRGKANHSTTDHNATDPATRITSSGRQVYFSARFGN